MAAYSVEQIDAILDAVFARLDAGWAPVWEGQTEMVRTIITLASGSLVITLSAVQFLADKVLPHWTWLVPASWVCFVVAVITGVIRHSWMSSARSFRLRFEVTRGTIRGLIKA